MQNSLCSAEKFQRDTACIMNALNVPGDVFFYCRLFNRHHGNWTISRQPVRTIIATSVVTDVVDITEQEGYCRELSYA